MDKWACMEQLTQAGFTLIPLIGETKNPKKDFPNTPYEMELDRSKFPANYGILLNDDVLVIDIDPRNFEPDDKPHVRLFKEIGLEIKGTTIPVVKTGSGGLHIFLKKPADIHTKEKIKGYRGIDFKSTRGRFMVGPGSIHPDTGKPYQMTQGDFRAMLPAPDKLIALLKSSHERKKHGEENTEDAAQNVYDQKEDIDRYVHFLETAPPAIEGDNGDQQTYRIACEGYNYGLSPSTTFELMLKHYNPRCVPSWSPEMLWKKVENAFSYAQGGAGNKSPEKEAAFKIIPQAGHVVKWDRGEKGQLKQSIQNCVNFFLLEKSGLAGAVAFDEFQGEVKIIKPLPWTRNREIPKSGVMWTDDDTVQCRFYLNHSFGFDPKSGLLDEAVLAAAHFRKIHPVREFLSGLVWDGKKRLHNWLTHYAGVEDDIYTREVSKKVLVQAVARVYHPGVKVDNVMVLEGKQGVGKSSLVAIMGGKWYADIVVDPHARDTVDAMRGKWIIEFSEMEVTRRADAQALKAFITRQTDRVRLAYGKRSIDYPRQCIFMGTINPDATREYFTDTTGNRRYWPIVCGNIKFGELERDRDQLLAEAVDTYFKGEALFVEDKHVIGRMSEEQESRVVTDPWTDSITDFVSSNEFVKDHNFTTTRELWELALRGTPTLFTKIHANRICSIMRKLGWTYNSFPHPVTKIKMKAFRVVGFESNHGIPDENQPVSTQGDIFS